MYRVNSLQRRKNVTQRYRNPVSGTAENERTKRKTRPITNSLASGFCSYDVKRRKSKLNKMERKLGSERHRMPVLEPDILGHYIKICIFDNE